MDSCGHERSNEGFPRGPELDELGPAFALPLRAPVELLGSGVMRRRLGILLNGSGGVDSLDYAAELVVVAFWTSTRFLIDSEYNPIL